MSIDDPFFVVKDEVEHSVDAVQQLYVRWRELQHSDLCGGDEYEWTANELKESIKSIEWDLEDLDETVSIVESNPVRFDITPEDMQMRKGFIADTCKAMKAIRDDVNSQATKAKEDKAARGQLMGPSTPHNKYEKLEQEMDRENDDFIDEQRKLHKLEMAEQDRNMEMVGDTVVNLKTLGKDIGRELDDHNVLLDDLDDQMERTESQLQRVVGKVEKILESVSDKKQYYAILILSVALIIMIILYVVL
ncbi:hypothetical protein SARC_02649 [Sphaeroforma arctica JP610]|uniref:t-SNARE coiled-coil homology domain-containing protein n=1 Tax=Sphaeroforma arctica JP610 TaxID=667725 RepID=A0A0L0G8F4_9EUKA|nr:hypothetical protein SARC_02649 [Sphaeroforma arctica JP610]KNC85156.1 hypothetical protein SARC_02649 [Sphaeroforma arctica JP610]|eukprot:XP_014159058.1 hypothetical protein SARC_02649 [Sphaeroforma arctica JP610]